MGLYPLVLVPDILLCVVPTADIMFVTLGSNLGFPKLRCTGLFRVWPSSLVLDIRTAVGVGSAVPVYLLWPGVDAFVLGMMCVWGVVVRIRGWTEPSELNFPRYFTYFLTQQLRTI